MTKDLNENKKKKKDVENVSENEKNHFAHFVHYGRTAVQAAAQLAALPRRAVRLLLSFDRCFLSVPFLR